MIKNFNILGFWGFTEKYDFYVTDRLKRGAWTACRFRGGGDWQERGGGVFEGGVDTPMHTMARSPSSVILQRFWFLNPVKRRKKSWS